MTKKRKQEISKQISEMVLREIEYAVEETENTTWKQRYKDAMEHIQAYCSSTKLEVADEKKRGTTVQLAMKEAEVSTIEHVLLILEEYKTI